MYNYIYFLHTCCKYSILYQMGNKEMNWINWNVKRWCCNSRNTLTDLCVNIYTQKIKRHNK